MAVSLTFTGNSNDAEAAIARLERKYNSLENALKQTSKTSKDTAGIGADAFLKFGMSVTGVSGVIDLASKAMSALKANYQDFLDMQDRAKDTNSNFAKTFTNLNLNLDPGQTGEASKKRILDLVKSAKMAPVDISAMLDIGQSAKGTLPDSTVDKTIEAISRLANLTPETAKNMVGSALSIQAARPGTTPEQAVGFIPNAASKSFVANPEKYAQHAMPGVIGMAGLDNTSLEYSASVQAGLSLGNKDAEGRSTRTAQMRLALQLAQKLPELKNTEERIKAVQEDPELRDALLNGTKHKGKNLPNINIDFIGPEGEHIQATGAAMSFEGKAFAGVRDLLTKGTPAYEQQQNALKNTPTIDNTKESYDRRVKNLTEDANFQAAQIENNLKITSEVAKIGNVTGARASVARKEADKALDDEGFSLIDRTAKQWRAWAKTGPNKSRFQAMQEVLQEDLAGHEQAMQQHLRMGTDGAPEAEKWAGKIRNVLRDMGPEEPQRNRNGMDVVNVNDAPDPAVEKERKEMEEMKKALVDNTKAVQENNELLGGGSRPGRIPKRNGNTE